MGDAAAWWEWRRISYNLALATVTGAWLILTWPHFRPALTVQSMGQLLVLAVLANLAYSTAYLIEMPVGDAAIRGAWRRRRWILWLAGTLFAVLLANYWIADEIYPYIGSAVQ